MTNQDSETADVASRPRSVVWYERLAWTALVTGLATTAANPASFAMLYDLYHGGMFILLTVASGGQLLWIWLIARRRQNWARWISLFVILGGILSILSMIPDIEERFEINPVRTTFYYTTYAISALSVLLLFRGDAREWFSRKRFTSGS